jgi:hypothetical protein
MTAQEIRSMNIEAPPLTALQSALLQANVRPLYTEDVTTYTAQKLAEERAKLLRGSGRHPWRALWAVPHAAGFVLVLSWLVRLPAESGFFLGFFCFMLTVAFALLAIATVISAFEREGGNVRLAARLQWRTYEVAECRNGKWVEYTHELRAPGVTTVTLIPAELRVAMRAIRKTGVEATFVVEQLDADPFLWVHDQVEKYCIGVWDEKGFIQ